MHCCVVEMRVSVPAAAPASHLRRQVAWVRRASEKQSARACGSFWRQVARWLRAGARQLSSQPLRLALLSERSWRWTVRQALGQAGSVACAQCAAQTSWLAEHAAQVRPRVLWQAWRQLRRSSGSPLRHPAVHWARQSRRARSQTAHWDWAGTGVAGSSARHRAARSVQPRDAACSEGGGRNKLTPLPESVRAASLSRVRVGPRRCVAQAG